MFEVYPCWIGSSDPVVSGMWMAVLVSSSCCYCKQSLMSIWVHISLCAHERDPRHTPRRGMVGSGVGPATSAGRLSGASEVMPQRPTSWEPRRSAWQETLPRGRGIHTNKIRPWSKYPEASSQEKDRWRGVATCVSGFVWVCLCLCGTYMHMIPYG